MCYCLRNCCSGPYNKIVDRATPELLSIPLNKLSCLEPSWNCKLWRSVWKRRFCRGLHKSIWIHPLDQKQNGGINASECNARLDLNKIFDTYICNLVDVNGPVMFFLEPSLKHFIFWVFQLRKCGSSLGSLTLGRDLVKNNKPIIW